jgi:hypothetical protein
MKSIPPTTEAKAIQNELATDLTLAFKVFGNDTLKIISEAEANEWTIQQIEQELMRI